VEIGFFWTLRPITQKIKIIKKKRKAKNKRLFFYVQDNGIGIRENTWILFFASSSVCMLLINGGGTGAGLTIAKKLWSVMVAESGLNLPMGR